MPYSKRYSLGKLRRGLYQGLSGQIFSLKHGDYESVKDDLQIAELLDVMEEYVSELREKIKTENVEDKK